MGEGSSARAIGSLVGSRVGGVVGRLVAAAIGVELDAAGTVVALGVGVSSDEL